MGLLDRTAWMSASTRVKVAPSSLQSVDRHKFTCSLPRTLCLDATVCFAQYFEAWNPRTMIAQTHGEFVQGIIPFSRI